MKILRYRPPYKEYKQRYSKTQHKYPGLKDNGEPLRTYIEDISFNFTGGVSFENEIQDYYDTYVCELYEQLIHKALIVFNLKSNKQTEHPDIRGLRTDIQSLRSEIANSVKQEVIRRESLSRDKSRYCGTIGVAILATLGTLLSVYLGYLNYRKNSEIEAIKNIQKENSLAISERLKELEQKIISISATRTNLEKKVKGATK